MKNPKQTKLEGRIIRHDPLTTRPAAIEDSLAVIQIKNGTQNVIETVLVLYTARKQGGPTCLDERYLSPGETRSLTLLCSLRDIGSVVVAVVTDKGIAALWPEHGITSLPFKPVLRLVITEKSQG